MALKVVLVVVLIYSYLPIIITCFSFSYPAIFNFGDSNSDTGGLAAGIAFPVGSPNGQSYFHKPSGRFCDGRLIIDFLVDAMDQPFLSPYLDAVGAPSYRTGCNFATGGSTILLSNASSISPFSFLIQIAQFRRFKAQVLKLLATKDKKTGKYLPTEDAFKRGLYMFDVGQNDLDAAFSSKSEEQVLAFIQTIVLQFQYGMHQLYKEGARNYWIHNTGPLGCLPRIIDTFGKNSSKLDDIGCVKSHNDAANLFNLQLHDVCTRFQLQFPETNVTYVDIFSIKSDLISNFAQYGFKEPLAACCGFGGPPLNFDKGIACGQSKNVNGSTVTANPCNSTADYVNWDGNHYTEAANRHVSQQILTGNYSNNPPIFDNVPFLVESESDLNEQEMLY